MKALVTGHSGFIGKRLCSYLEKEGVQVSKPDLDLSFPLDFSEMVDCVFHLGAVSNENVFCEDLQKGFTVNVMGTLNVLEYCKRSQAKLIFTSTCGVYETARRGDGPEKAILETHPLAPKTPYVRSKHMAELLCESYAKEYSVDSVVLRLFNVYGPGQHRKFLIPYLIHQALNDEEIQIRNPESKRDFIHLDDVVRVLALSAKRKTEGCQIFNVGSGNATQVLEVYETLEKILGAPLKISYSKESSEVIPSSISDPTKIKRELNWEPQIFLEKGLKKLMQL